MPEFILDQAAQEQLHNKHHINFAGGFLGFIQDGSNKNADGKFIPSNMADIANNLTMDDASLITNPNAALPVTSLMYQSPKAIKVLLAKRAATEMYDEVKYGSFADALVQWRIDEVTGAVEVYNDYDSKSVSGTNYNWVVRENFRFSTSIRVGDLESEEAGKNKISLMADRQKAAYTTIAVAHNKFQLYGVKGKRIYGILNDPNMLPAISPKANASGDTEWQDKDTVEIYGDILDMFAEMVTNSGDLVDANTPLTLSLAPAAYVLLATPTSYGKSVLDMLNAYFKNLKIVSVPELAAADGVLTARLSADNVEDQKTGECCISEKLRTFTAVRETSSIHQKVAGGTIGAVIYRPVLVVTMTGV